MLCHFWMDDRSTKLFLRGRHSIQFYINYWIVFRSTCFTFKICPDDRYTIAYKVRQNKICPIISEDRYACSTNTASFSRNRKGEIIIILVILPDISRALFHSAVLFSAFSTSQDARARCGLTKIAPLGFPSQI